MKEAERMRKSRLLGFEHGRCPLRRESSGEYLLRQHEYRVRRTSGVSKAVPLQMLQQNKDIDPFDEPVTDNLRLRTRLELERGLERLNIEHRMDTGIAEEPELESSTETLSTAVDGAFELAMPLAAVGGGNGLRQASPLRRDLQSEDDEGNREAL
jgi:hypothetical protein